MTTMRIETDQDGTLKVKLGKGEWAACVAFILAAGGWLFNQDRQLNSISSEFTTQMQQVAKQLASQDHRLERMEQLYFTRKDAP